MFRGVLGVEVCDLVRALRMLTHKIIAQPFNLHMNTHMPQHQPESIEYTMHFAGRASRRFSLPLQP